MLRRPRWQLAAVLTAAALLGGCGDNGDSAASKAFGGLSKSDETALSEAMDGFGGFPAHQARFRRALQEEDIATARKSVDAMYKEANGLLADAVALENAKLRTTLRGYARAMHRAVVAYDKVVTLAEEELDTGVPTDAKLLDEAIQDALAATERAQREDDRLIDRLAAPMSPSQRRDFLRRYKARIQELERQAQPG